MEEFPCADEILNDVDVRTRLDIEIACIEKSPDIQARDELVGFVFRFGLCALTVQVEVVALRSLEVALLEWFAVPSAVTFVHIHVVHVDGHPHVGRSIGDFVINVFINEEVVGTSLAVLDVINARLAHR